MIQFVLFALGLNLGSGLCLFAGDLPGESGYQTDKNSARENKSKFVPVVTAPEPVYGRPVLTARKKILNIYQQAHDLTRLLEKHGIVYWITGGSLLGVVRHRGVIPWDGDFDVCIAPGEEAKIMPLGEELEKLGYRLFLDESVPYRIQQIHRSRGAPVDIFSTYEENGKIYYQFWPGGARDGDRIHFKAEEVFPLRKYRFGAISVWGPNSPEPYLDNEYKNWKTIGVQTDLHSNDLEQPIIFLLKPRDLNPAQPFGPLKENYWQKRDEVELVRY